MTASSVAVLRHAAAVQVLEQLDAPDLGRLAQPLLPASVVGEAGSNSLILLRAIGSVLAAKERAA